MKIYYDQKHKPVEFKRGDKVYITLAKGGEPGYRLPAALSGKLSERRVGPFKILERIGKLAYKLELPSTWKIHPVISIAHLERHEHDEHGRTVPPPPPDIVDGNEEWEVKEVVRKRYNKRRKRWEYNIKWKNYGTEHNTWEPLEHLKNAAAKVDEFEKTQNMQITSTRFLQPIQSPTRIPHYKTNVIPRC
jgi:hypothetical protein